MVPPNDRDLLMDIREKLSGIVAHLEDQKDRIKKVEDNQSWLWRTMVGAIILGCVSLLFKSKG